MRIQDPRVLALASFLVLAAGLQAQPRPCLDVTADGTVNEEDVTIVQEAVAAMRPDIDPRGDFDLLSGVTVEDAVNLKRVSEGEQLAALDFLPRAAARGQEVVILVQNADLLDPLGLLVVTVDGGSQTVTVTATLDPRGIVFVLPPDLDPPDISNLPDIRRAFPGDLTGLALVTFGDGTSLSNTCAIRVLPPGATDRDGDAVPDSEDLCPDAIDPVNGDTDFDGVGDACDNCPGDPNPNQEDANGDGSGDACAPDAFIFLNDQLVEPEPGVDPALQDLPVERPHAVLVLTRAKSPEIKAELLDAGVDVVEALARQAFVVRGLKPNLSSLAGFSWFHALFPLTPSLRLGDNIAGGQPEPPRFEVTFHADVSPAEASARLSEVGAVIVAPGVDILNDQGQLVERVRTWQVELPGGYAQLNALASFDEVLNIGVAHPNVTTNATSRAALQVVPLNLAGLNGAGRNVGEWDGGWAAGDPAPPPGPPVPPPPGGPNPALAPRVMVRDHLQGFEGIAPPPGCAGAITCNALCGYSFHATHVGGTFAGNGNLWFGGVGPDRGMASLATLRSYEWSDNNAEAICERRDAIANFGTFTHNNSWGFRPQAPAQCAGIMGFYHARSAAYDQSIRQLPRAAEMFAAGNDQERRNMFGPACAMPPIFNPAACTPSPPGVPAPPIFPIPPVATTNRFFTVEAPGGTAKSTVTVGNMDFPNNRLFNESSIGPTRDGRLKPEVVAHGTLVSSTCGPPGLQVGPNAFCDPQGYVQATGTSMATPAVAGATALLYEHGINVGRPLQSDCARALLAHTARDLGAHPGGVFLNVAGGPVGGQWQPFGGADGPDFLTGYGLVDAQAARNHITNGNLGGVLQPTGCPNPIPFASIPFHSPIAVGGSGPPGCPQAIWDVVYKINLPAGLSELKVTIAWNDPPAAPGANPTLINDLDLMVAAPNGIYHYPWWLDPACPWRPAARVQSAQFNNALFSDHRNTLEQVHVVGGLQAGLWAIIVRSGGLAQGPQPFAIMISAQ